MKVLGLMSGTSADGVDAVLADFSGRPARPRWRILASAASPYPASLRQQLVAAGQGEALAARDWLELAEAVTDAQAEAARWKALHGELMAEAARLVGGQQG